MKFAVIKTGGKQYIVTEGQVLKIEKLLVGESKEVIFDNVLLRSDDEKVEVGQPYLDKPVKAEFIRQLKGIKTRAEKFKPKVRYHKVSGHRQHLTEVKITSI